MGELINGRTPEEIKRRIEWHAFPCPEGGCNDCVHFDVCEPYPDNERLAKETLALIERLESERDAALAKQPKWISVDERLPEERGIYLAHVMHSYNKEDLYDLVCVEYFNPEDGWSSLSDLYEVTHWMPLPEPPKEGE